MKYRCRYGHIANDPDYCRACLGNDYQVMPVQPAPEPAAPAPEPEAKPEELTPVIEPVSLVDLIGEAAALPVSKYPGRKR